MGFKALKVGRGISNLSFRDQSILSLIAELVEDGADEWTAFPGIDYLSGAGKCNERTVYRALNSLEGAGVLEAGAASYKPGSLHLDPLPSPPDTT